MSFIRVWEQLDIDKVKDSLVLIGELSAQCYMCKSIGIKFQNGLCSNCGREFKYMGFRRKVDSGYLNKIREDFPHMKLIDWEDFKRAVGKKDARSFLDI